MLDHDCPKSETLTDLAAFSGPADLGEVVCGRFAAPPEGLRHAFNANQVASKTWLLDRTHEALGGDFGTVHVLGGWYGALGALLLGDARFRAAQVLSYDIDPACAPVADLVNAEASARGRFKAITADAASLEYALGTGHLPNLVVNTSCEHMPAAVDWYGRVPTGMPMVVQSNDYFDCDEHVNCVVDLAALKAQLPMSELYYEGMLQRRRYSRFMLIGRK
jgi:hypothetical protein